MKIDLTETADMEFKPTLYDVHKVLDQEIVGEYTSRMSLFTNWVLADRFVLMSGPRSSGKTWCTDHVRKYFLGDLAKNTGTAYSITMGSKKSAWYQVDKINKSTHIVIFELNQVPDGFEEVLKLWGEGKDASYKVTVNMGGSFHAKEQRLEYKPTVLCLADEQEKKLNDQLWSRLTIIRTDASINQNKRVLKHQAELSRRKKNPKQVDVKLTNSLRTHISTMPAFKDLEFKHPASTVFTEAIPPFFTDCRRDFPKYLDNTFGITRFYWKERIRNKHKDKTRIFVTPQDMFYNHVIYGKNVIESALKCNRIQRDMIEIIKVYGKEADRKFIQKNLRKLGYNVSANMCSRHLNELNDIGYLDKEKKGRKVYYSVGDLFNEFKFNINWSDVIKECKRFMREEYPEHSSEYIKKYCDNPIITHPFSGSKMNLLDIKESKIDLTQAKEGLDFFVNQTKKEKTKKEVNELEDLNEIKEDEDYKNNNEVNELDDIPELEEIKIGDDY